MNRIGSLAWRKSSHSGNSDNCVEVVEVVELAARVAVRDSKVPGRALTFGADEWGAFLCAIQRGALG